MIPGNPGKYVNTPHVPDSQVPDFPAPAREDGAEAVVLPRLLTFREVAAHLGTSERTIRNICARSTGLRVIRMGRIVRIDARDLAVFLENQKNSNK